VVELIDSDPSIKAHYQGDASPLLRLRVVSKGKGRFVKETLLFAKGTKRGSERDSSQRGQTSSDHLKNLLMRS
jgi:hypothetical protein